MDSAQSCSQSSNETKVASHSASTLVSNENLSTINNDGQGDTQQVRNTKISWSWQHETMEAPICIPRHPTGAAVLDTDMYTYQHIATLDGHTSAITRIEWSPDGKHLATGARDWTVCIWAMPFTGYITRSECVSLLMLDGWATRDFAWAPNGKAIIVVGDKVRIWKEDQGIVKKEIRGVLHQNPQRFPSEVISIIEEYVSV